ncbi:hypothetical protein K227x_05370 [Rubripirellula lacrimiformis]|uniref:Uncharacterized protein n=1 Tax=Rubripirellula lacrimiformis TaxID=1930273 RepID=A0A517N4V5_9BACT|nr:Lpg1974 family pore-forming outer membrane protein [Rubripirellula lacrimiformis]QDT02166.1 hypothetical protein K227x_05370 [Rubripirellula lacrimiformis]
MKLRRETDPAIHSWLIRTAMGLLLIALHSCPNQTAWGQDFSLDGFSISDPKPTDQDSAAGEEAIAKVGFNESLAMGTVQSHEDLLAEVAGLRSRMLQQEMKTASRDFKAFEAEPGRRWFATYENLLIQPLQSNSTAVIVQTDDGYTHLQFPWELSYSPRVQIGSEATGGLLGWRVRYWRFNQNERFSANDANGLIPTGSFGSVGFLSEEGDIVTGVRDLAEGSFNSEVRADVIDWELQQQLSPSFDVYAGIRYGKIAQSYQAKTDEGDVFSSSEFRGFGPTVSLRMRRSLPVDHISLFCNLRGSMLLGHKAFHADDNIVDNFSQSIGAVDLRSYADGMDTLVGNAEIQLGVLLTMTEWLNISVALEAQHYGNVGGANPTAVFTGDDGGINGDGPMDDGIGFAGVSVGSEISW